MTDTPFDPSMFFSLLGAGKPGPGADAVDWDEEGIDFWTPKQVTPAPEQLQIPAPVGPAIPDVPKDDSPGSYGNMRRMNTETDLSWARRKSDAVNVSHLNDVISGYLNQLPAQYRKDLVITSGNDQKHATHSKHYHNNAVDLRYSPGLHNFINSDPVAAQIGLRVLNPNHGTAPHTHLELRGDGGEKQYKPAKDNLTPAPVRMVQLPPKRGAEMRASPRSAAEPEEGFLDLMRHKLVGDLTPQTEAALTDHYTRPVWNGLRKASAVVALASPEPVSRTTAAAMNAMMGAVDAREKYLQGDKRGAAFEAAMALPVPIPARSVIGPFEKFAVNSTDKWIPYLLGVNAVQAGSEFIPEENKPMSDYRDGGFVLPHFATGGDEVPGYSQYRPDTREAIASGRLHGASTLDAIETYQHQGPQYYGSGQLNMNEFYQRQGGRLAQIPGFDPRNQEHVRAFQNIYNKDYQNATGQPYFDGSNPRGIDGKFGKYTWSAPAINETPEQKPPMRRGIRYEKLHDTLGNQYYSPIPVGDYTSSEWRHIVNSQLPEKFGDVQVLRGQPYFDMYAGPNRKSTDQWKTTEDTPRTFEQLPSPQHARTMATTPVEPPPPQPQPARAAAMTATGRPGRMMAYSPTFALGGASPDSATDDQPLFVQPTEQQQFQHDLAYAPMTQQDPQQPVRKKPGFDYQGVSDFAHLLGSGIASFQENRQARQDWNRDKMSAGFAQNQFGMQESNSPNGLFSLNAGNGAAYQGSGYTQGHYAQGGSVDVGGEYDLSDDEIASLRAQGYQVDLI